MLDFTNLNYFAISAAWVINIVIGGWWYSPAGFGKQWSRLSGVDMMKTPKQETNRAIMFVAVSSLLQAFALAVALNSLQVTTTQNGLVVALFLWFGFVAITTVGNTLYQRQSWKFLWLNASYFLVVMAINGMLLSLWK
ncbi:MAG: DUF1761 domain-containing protein [Candidatus Saccharimonas sp.]